MNELKPFQPKDEKSERAKLHEAFDNLPSGTFVSYKEIQNVLGRDIRGDEGRGGFYQFWNDEAANGRPWQVVMNEGYVIITPTDALSWAIRRKLKKAIKQAKVVRQILDGIPMNELNSNEQRQVREYSTRVGRDLTGMRSTRLRFNREDNDKSKEQNDHAVIQSRKVKIKV